MCGLKLYYIIEIQIYRKILNMGGNKLITLKQLYSIFKKILGDKVRIKKFPLPKYDKKISLADMVYTEKILKWKPETKITDLIIEIIKNEFNK